MLVQEQMIEAVREVSAHDEELGAALMYGSFAKGEGDEYSDIEFWLFFQDDAVPKPRAWIERIAPVTFCFHNEWGTDVAFFTNGIRGEFHFHPASRMDVIEEWATEYERGGVQVVLDRAGRLTEAVARLEATPADRLAPERVQGLCDRFANGFVMGRDILARGEAARALNMLAYIHIQLIRMVRVLEGSYGRHWATPSRALEQDISPEAYQRYQRCSAPLDAAALRRAYAEAEAWGGELMAALARQYGVESRAPVLCGGQRALTFCTRTTSDTRSLKEGRYVDVRHFSTTCVRARLERPDTDRIACAC